MVGSDAKARCTFLCAMRFMRIHGEQLDTNERACVLPPGTPDWVTAELVEVTLRIWQRYYDEPLTVDDAVTMILNAGQLYSALARR